MSASGDYSKVRSTLKGLGRYATCNEHVRGGTPPVAPRVGCFGRALIELGWMEEIMSRLIYP